MRPTFGCRIHELVFAPLHAGTFTAARHYIADALAMWEPRIDVTEIEVEPAMNRDIGNCLYIAIHYRIRATHDERSLVWPFYMIPAEP
jgi:phage baseplate assembly protein W